MNIYDIGSLLLRIATTPEAAGVAASIVIGMFLKYIPPTANFWKAAFSVLVNLLVAPAALLARWALYGDAITAESLRTSVLVGIATAWMAYTIWKQALTAAANHQLAKASAPPHSPLDDLILLPQEATIPAAYLPAMPTVPYPLKQPSVVDAPDEPPTPAAPPAPETYTLPYLHDLEDVTPMMPQPSTAALGGHSNAQAKAQKKAGAKGWDPLEGVVDEPPTA